MKKTDDLVLIVAGFYAAMYGEKLGPRDYTAAMLELFEDLHADAFSGYVFDPKKFLRQADAQLRGNDLAVRNYRTVSFWFAPKLAGTSRLAVHMGALKKEPNGTLGIWADDPAIDQKIQAALGDGCGKRKRRNGGHHLLSHGVRQQQCSGAAAPVNHRGSALKTERQNQRKKNV